MMKSKIPKKILSGKKNYIASNRRLTTFRRHFPIVFKPFAMAIILTAGWYFLIYKNNLGFDSSAENPLLFLILPLVSFVYVIFASIAINSVFDEYKTVSRSVVQRDLDTFLLHRDEQLPILLNILVAIPSLFLIVLSAVLHYENVWIGMSAVFCVTFIVVTAWLVATELDNFEKSIWFRESIPKDWLEVDVQEYFDRKQSNRK